MGVLLDVQGLSKRFSGVRVPQTATPTPDPSPQGGGESSSVLSQHE